MNNTFLFVLFGIIIILIIYNNCNYNQEPFDNICKEMQFDFKDNILKYNNAQIKDLKLEKYVEIIIKPFIDFKEIDSIMTIEKYFITNNLPSNQINSAIILVKSIINNNCLMSALSEYDITPKSTLKDIIQTYLIDNLKNSLICLISNKQAIELIVQQILLLIVKPYVEICSKDKFIEYCERNYNNIEQGISDNILSDIVVKDDSGNSKKRCNINKKRIEKFANELDAMHANINKGGMQLLDIESKMLPLLNNSSKFMSTVSIENVIQTFDSTVFGKDLEPYMNNLMLLYKQKYRKDLNISNKKDFSNFVILLIDDFKDLISELRGDYLCTGDNDDSEEVELLVNKFNSYKKIYLMLKHYYKIVLVYELINTNIKDNDVKLQSMLCCSKKGEKSCYNFSNDLNNPSAIIYGFNDIGYVNSVKCIQNSPEAIASQLEQDKTLDEILSIKYDLWKNLSKDNKNLIYININNLFKIYGVNLTNIDDNLSLIRKQFINISKPISINDINKILNFSSGTIINKLQVNDNKDYNQIIQLLDKINNISDLIKLLSDNGFNKEQIIFNSNVTLDISKSIAKVALFSKYLFSNFSYTDNSNTVVKIIGILNTKQTFSEIFSETNIIPRNFMLILQTILSSIKNSDFAILNDYDINSVPSDVIKYIKSKPTDISMNLCNVYSIALDKFRKDRVIDINEYTTINEKIILYCDPNKLKITDITADKIPINESKGLNVLDRTFQNYPDFIKEQKYINDNNMKVDIAADNILFNVYKNLNNHFNDKYN